ncbi:MAG: glycosyltransferase [Polyangiaceae bacterium]|nr:glycosyltransferase [Polyangiaceae bacterium]
MALNVPRHPVEQAASRLPASEFDQREAERRRHRVEAYDRIAEWREEHVAKHHYYSEQVRRLVGSLVVDARRVLEVGCGLGDLLASLPVPERVGIDISPRMIELAKQRHPGETFFVADVERDPLPEGPFDVIILSDAIGHLDDIQRAFERIYGLLSPKGRFIVTYYNFVWEPALKLAERLGMKTPWPDQNWLSMGDIENLLRLADFDPVRQGTNVLVPFHVPVVSEIANRALSNVPVLREASLIDYFVARPLPKRMPAALPSVSIICPTKNERGNIREAVRRTPLMGSATEIVFVDGNSNDGTREEIQTVIAEYKGPLQLRLVDQGDGKGKGDAVRKGFAAAKYDVLMILDSDLTVPPEDLPKFYDALVTSKGEFINGVRLVYPMEGQAMRFLNLLGNKFFGAALAWLLEQHIKDSLCGTKVLYRRDYERIAENRAFFGEFDPFGDFDLLFGAARLNLKIVDLPVRYRARTYGDTKISRFSHGWLLLKMTAFGFRKLRMGL